MEDNQLQALAKYQNQGFSQEQLEEIELGLQSGYDVSIYARLDIPASEMAHIRKYLNLYKSKDSEVKKEEKDDFDKVNEEYKKIQIMENIVSFDKLIVFILVMCSMAIIVGMTVCVLIAMKL